MPAAGDLPGLCELQLRDALKRRRRFADEGGRVVALPNRVDNEGDELDWWERVGDDAPAPLEALLAHEREAQVAGAVTRYTDIQLPAGSRWTGASA